MLFADTYREMTEAGQSVMGHPEALNMEDGHYETLCHNAAFTAANTVYGYPHDNRVKED